MENPVGTYAQSAFHCKESGRIYITVIDTRTGEIADKYYSKTKLYPQAGYPKPNWQPK